LRPNSPTERTALRTADIARNARLGSDSTIDDIRIMSRSPHGDQTLGAAQSPQNAQCVLAIHPLSYLVEFSELRSRRSFVFEVDLIIDTKI